MKVLQPAALPLGYAAQERAPDELARPKRRDDGEVSEAIRRLRGTYPPLTSPVGFVKFTGETPPGQATCILPPHASHRGPGRAGRPSDRQHRDHRDQRPGVRPASASE